MYFNTLLKAPNLLLSIFSIFILLNFSCAKDQDFLFAQAIEEEIEANTEEVAEEESEENTEENDENSGTDDSSNTSDPDAQDGANDNSGDNGNDEETSRNIEASYFVAPGANGSGDSTTNPMSIEEALKVAGPGDKVVLKGGDYGNVQLTQNLNGAAGNMIYFVGMDSNWNEFTKDDAPTIIDFYQEIDVNAMPTFSGDFSGDVGKGTAVMANGNYVHWENIQIRHYEKGMILNGNNNRLQNVNFDKIGHWNIGSNTTYTGYGIQIIGGQNTFLQCSVRDAQSQGFSINSDNNYFENVYAIATCNGDCRARESLYGAMDYYFLILGDNNEMYNINVLREYFNEHEGHGIVFKPRPERSNGDSTGNLIDGFFIFNTILELQSIHCNNNIIRNGIIRAEQFYKGHGNSDWHEAIRIYQGANNNIFKNILVEGFQFAMSYQANTETGYPYTFINQPAGYENQFINMAFKDCNVAINYGSRANNVLGASTDNDYINCTWHNIGTMFWQRRPSSGNRFINCIMDNVSNFSSYNEYPMGSDTMFQNVNLTNSFSLSNLTQFSNQSLTEVSFSFTNPGADDLTISSDALDIGLDPTQFSTEASTDFLGKSRNAPYTLGAFEN